MILVTLILALEFIQKSEGSPKNQTKQITEELTAAVQQTAAMKMTVAAAQEEISKLRTALAQSEDTLLETVKVESEQMARSLRDLEELNKMLADELAQSTKRAQEVDSAKKNVEAEQATKTKDKQSLEEINKQVQQKLEELRKLRAANRVIFNLTQAGPKSAWMVELSTDKILAAEAGKKQPPQSFGSAGAFVAWARKRNRQSEYFVLLVKPTTIQQFESVRDALEKSNFDVGFDLLKTDQTAIDPQVGAASP